MKSIVFKDGVAKIVYTQPIDYEFRHEADFIFQTVEARVYDNVGNRIWNHSENTIHGNTAFNRYKVEQLEYAWNNL